MTYRVHGRRPIAKINSVALAGAATVVIAWALRQWAGIDMPAEVQAAMTTLVATLAGYLTPIRPGEIVSDEQEQ